MTSSAAWMGLEAQPVESTYLELPGFLLRSGPAIVRLPDPDANHFLLLLKGTGKHVSIVGNDRAVHSVPLARLEGVLAPHDAERVGGMVDKLLDSVGLVGLDGTRRQRAREVMMREQLGQTVVSDSWILRLPASARTKSLVRCARLPQYLLAFCGVHTVQYLLWIASWWVIGRGALEGRVDSGWLAAWVLLLLTMIPFRLLATWFEGLLSIRAGALLKQRLLQGALRLRPDEIRHEGAGHHLSRVLESEAVEDLALTGGFLALVAGIELVISTAVLATGAGSGYQVLLLVAWLGFASVVGRDFFRRRRRWTQLRLRMSHELVDKMVGHRTRLAQQSPERWHEGEDEELARYLGVSRAMDRTTVILSALPRGWLFIGVLGLAPSVISGQASASLLAVALGGMLLAYRALDKLVDGFSDLADAVIAWEQVSPLFYSARRREAPGDPALVIPPHTERPSTLLEAESLGFRYPDRASPVIKETSFRISVGDRALVASPSGGGKSTLVSLLNGLRTLDSGSLLLYGLDPQRLGAERWTRRVAAAPQFNENHVFTETFAFNLLMGRGWPPQPGDLEAAQTLCQELGLGELIERMPGGLFQMVGEMGWQLSHGEKSRLYIARALLQGADVVILDESFAALDPDNFRRSLACALDHAPSLLVTAHT
jgi:ATP-binding cassette subfamily B protein